MKTEDRICLGKIVGAQGLKGEVKIKSFTEFEEDIDQYGALEDKTGSKKFNIKITGFSKGVIKAVIKGVNDRNGAEALVGTELYVSRDLLPELDDDEFYHADLVGLDVKLKSTGEEVGKVSGLYNFGAGDILEIKLIGTNKTEMIPFTEAFVPEINIKDGFIIVESVVLSFAEDEKNEG